MCYMQNQVNNVIVKRKRERKEKKIISLTLYLGPQNSQNSVMILMLYQGLVLIFRHQIFHFNYRFRYMNVIDIGYKSVLAKTDI